MEHSQYEGVPEVMSTLPYNETKVYVKTNVIKI
jgi:hypothetical protein